MTLSICAVTGGRADWGLLSVPLVRLRDHAAFDLKLVVTGQHLAPGGEDGIAAIEAGFSIDARLDMLLAADTPLAVTKSLGLAVIGFADIFERLRPDLLLLLGDRYEILAAAQAALIARIPVAHLCGGDLTEGAMDEAIRHSITKMAHIHFVTNAEAGHRLRQLGENPGQVHCVGSPGLDLLREVPVLERGALFAAIGFTPRRRNLLVTFHPVTLDEDSGTQCTEMLAALDALGPETGLIFTGVNADTGAHAVAALIDAFVATHANAKAYGSLGSRHYLNLLRQVDAVVGNSSSGLYEAPSFHIPTVNIGDRQGGRLKAASVIDCAPERQAIGHALRQAAGMDCSGVINPYGDGHAAERIVAVLETLGDLRALLKKRFHEGKAP